MTTLHAAKDLKDGNPWEKYMQAEQPEVRVKGFDLGFKGLGP